MARTTPRKFLCKWPRCRNPRRRYIRHYKFAETSLAPPELRQPSLLRRSLCSLPCNDSRYRHGLSILHHVAHPLVTLRS